MKIAIGFIVALLLVGLIASTQITIFVIHPIGVLPEGQTLIITRKGNLNFIDSADGICERMQGGVSLLCRLMVMGMIAKESTIIARLPYSEALYLISTDGRTYER